MEEDEGNNEEKQDYFQVEKIVDMRKVKGTNQLFFGDLFYPFEFI